MENDAFEKCLHRFLEERPSIFFTVPAGTCLWSLSPLPEEKWLPRFVSAQAGRWNLDGEPAKYFGNNLATCLAEVTGTNDEVEGCVVEHWCTTAPLRTIDISAFPISLQQAMFECAGLPFERWAKCHLFLKRLKIFPECRTVPAIKAPSAYGCALEIPGYTLATNPLDQPLEFVGKSSLAAR